MSTSKNQNAFPTTHHSGRGASTKEGMTLRDYFAAKAMQRLLSEIDCERVIGEQSGYMLRQVTDASYKVADAMLTEREKTIKYND